MDIYTSILAIVAGLGLAILVIFAVAMWLAWKNRKKIGKLGIAIIGLIFIAVGVGTVEVLVGVPILMAGIVLVGEGLGIDIPKKVKQLR
jgi:heme A synthase